MNPDRPSRRERHMGNGPDRRLGFSSFTIWRLFAVVAILLASAAILLSSLVYYDGASERERIRDAQIESCVQVGQPLTEAVIQLLEGEVEQFRRIDLEALFPNVSSETLDELIKEETIRNQEIIRLLRDAPTCEERSVAGS